MADKRFPTEEERRAAYIARLPEVCLDCGERGLKDQPCGNCEADAQARKDLSLYTKVPPVLRPSYPPYAHCVEIVDAPELPENAGRHAAPNVSDAMQTLGELTVLRSLGGPRRCC